MNSETLFDAFGLVLVLTFTTAFCGFMGLLLWSVAQRVL